jgi:16S rRNA (guanine966-N2)-methyltransferase
MRVIAGEAKGRTLVVPRGGETRSATDRIRETMFAILEPALPQATVLDLFAGAGTLGIEALSRGAAHATFVERGRDAVRALERNLKTTGFLAKSDVISEDVARYLTSRPTGPFTLAFADPPFADVSGLAATLGHPGLRAALAPDAVVVARFLRKHPPVLPREAVPFRVKEIGEENIVFLRYAGPAAGG